jgi:hypothetical protein
MRKSFFFLAFGFLLSAPLPILAQYTFPLVEMVKLTTKNPSDFETVMLERDYSVDTKLSVPTTKIYTSDKPGATGKKYTFSRHQLPNATPDLIFTSTDKKYYLDFKAKLATSGYKFVKEENRPIGGTPAVWYDYSNGVYRVSICSYTTDDKYFTVQVRL